MAQDMFGKSISYGGGFSSDATIMNLSGIDSSQSGPASTGGQLTGMLVRELNVQYQQSVNRVYELGSNNVYFICGRSAGQASMGRIISESNLVNTFLSLIGNICLQPVGGFTLNLAGSMHCGSIPSPSGSLTPNGFNISLNAPVLVGVSLAVQAEQMLITEGLQIMFASMNYNS